MRRIAHISDLHFGRHEERTVAALEDSLRREQPAVIAVSGDLTQRARPREFARARAFIDGLSAPVVVVPGNHDVPLYDVWRRFTAPLERFRHYIGPELTPQFVDRELVIVGINTARSLTFKGGRISRAQIAVIGQRFGTYGAGHFKVLVSHHPFIPHPRRGDLGVVGRSALALATLEEVGVQVLLTGHLHLGFTGDVTAHYPGIRRSMVVVHAGTAVSTRRRGEPNAYNLLTVDLPRLRCEARVFDGRSFADVEVTDYVLEDHTWTLVHAQA